MSTEFPEILDRFFQEEIKRVTLTNDLSLLLKEEPGSQLVSLQFWVKTGSIHEEAWLGSGLSHYLEHLMFKGTSKRSGLEITRLIQESGGYINAYTTFDRTVYYIVAPSEKLELMLSILTDIIFNSLLQEEDVKKEQEIILREIAMGNDDPDRRVSQALFRTAFQQHPYRHPVIGNRELFTQVTREALVEYYNNRYVPNNVTVVLVGDFENESVLPKLNKILGKYPQKRLEPVYIPDEPHQLAPRSQHLFGDVQICRAGLGFKIPHLAHPDAPALDMLAGILGSGHSSLLWTELRDRRKLVHAIDASSWNPGSSGLFWISFIGEPENHGATEQAVLELIEKTLESGFNPELLEKSRRQALVSEINLRKTVSGMASRIGLAEVVVGDLSYIERYFKKLFKITPDDLISVLRTYLVQQSMSSVSFNQAVPTSKPKGKGRKSRVLSDFGLKTLSNGARLLWQRDQRLPKVHMRYVGLGGPLYEDEALRGVTGVMTTLLNRDTTRQSAAEIALEVEKRGGVFTEFVGNNTFGLAVEVLQDDLPFACEILHNAVIFPAFREDTFYIERDAQSAQIREDLDDILECGKKMLRKRFFGKHPYAVDAFGKLDSVAALTIPAIQGCYEQLCCGENTVLSVVGDIDPDRDLDQIEALLATLPSKPFKAANPVFKGPAHFDQYKESMSREQAVVFMAFPDLGVRHGNFHNGEILEEFFSDMSGNLFMRVREELGLAYYVGAQRVTGLDCGMFYFYAGTRPDAVEKVWEEITRELNRILSDGISSQELERCKTRLKVQKRTSRQNIGTRAMQTALDVIYDLPLNNWKNYDRQIDAISRTQIQDFVANHLNPERSTGLIIGPF